MRCPLLVYPRSVAVPLALSAAFSWVGQRGLGESVGHPDTLQTLSLGVMGGWVWGGWWVGWC